MTAVGVTSVKNGRWFMDLCVQSQAVIYPLRQILPRSQVAFGGLDGSMAEQKLNLFEVPAGVAA